MRKIPIVEAQPGQVVLRSITGSGGVALVRPGTQLTAEFIRRLEALGVSELYIEGEGRCAVALPERVRQLDERFAGHEGSELMMQLKQLVISQLT